VFRRCEVNQRTEARGLEKRCRCKSEGGAMTETRASMEIRMEARVTITGVVGLSGDELET
jgi:hypothetical protein